MSTVRKNYFPPRQKPTTFWFRVNRAIKRRRQELKKIFDEDEKRLRLEKPIHDYLLSVHRRMDREGIPLKERTVILGKDRWPKQYKAGIDRVFGMDIKWVEGNV